MSRHLGARNLGNNPIRSNDPALIITMNSVYAITHDRQRETQVSGRTDQFDALPQVEVHDASLEIGLVWTVDEIEAVRRFAKVGLDTINRFFDPSRRQASRTEKTEQTRPARGFDDLGRADPIGHGAREIWIFETMIGTERSITQPFHSAGRDVSLDRKRAIGSYAAECRDAALSDSKLAVAADRNQRISNLSYRSRQIC